MNSKQPFGTRNFASGRWGQCGEQSQELELLDKHVDAMTGITEVLRPMLKRLETLEAKMSKIEKEKS